MRRRVLVTGASRGIGRAIAVELARAGFALALNYRGNEAAAREVRASITEQGGEAELVPFDVADRAGAGVALAAELAARGPFWGIVLNAGVGADAPFASLKGEDWDRVLRTNLDGFYNVIQPLIMPMVRLRQGGRIVTISSVSGLKGNRGQVNYSASKAGLIGATRSLALELAKRAITVNCVAPGFIATDMLADLDTAALAETIPLRRLGEAAEVAALVGFLFGERAGYVTGQVLAIDGGLT